MSQKIAVRLVEYRLAAGLSQEKLAERLNVSRQAVSKWERAESLPDIGNIVALADLYGVTVDELLREPKSEEPASPEAKGGFLAGVESDELGGAQPCGSGEDAGKLDNGEPYVQPEIGSEDESPAGSAGGEFDGPGNNPMEGLESSEANGSEADDSEGDEELETLVHEGATAVSRMPSAWRSRKMKVAVAAVVTLLMTGVLAAIFVALDRDNAPSSDSEPYQVSPTYPLKELVDESYYAEGTGSFAATGVVSAIRLDWPRGNVTIRKASSQETNGALVVKEKGVSGASLQWRQEGGLLTISQPKNGGGSSAAEEGYDESAYEPSVEILVPDALSILDSLQLNISGGAAEVQGLYLMNLGLRQYSGSAFFRDNDIMRGCVELAQGLLNMEGAFAQEIELTQNNGDSTIVCQGEPPATMRLEVNGGLASVGLEATEGCQLHYDRTGGELLVYFPDEDAFPDLFHPTGFFAVGEESTLINAKINGGALAVGDRLRIKANGMSS